MASTGTRLRWQSYSPLIKCRLPGPQLPAHTARWPERCASAPAAKAAVSSCLTGIHRSWSCRRMASVIPLSESPATPYIRETPRPTRVSTSRSATVFFPMASPLFGGSLISAHFSCHGASFPLRGRPVEGGTIPPGEVGSGFVRALKEIQHQLIRRGCRAHRLVRQNEVVQLSTIVGGRGPDRCRPKAGRLGSRVGIECRVGHRTAPRPESKADFLV